MPELWFDEVAGSDANPGTFQSPKRGVSPPIRDFLLPGNIVNVKRGSRYSQANGSTGQNISKTDVGGWVLRAYGDAQTPPIFDGFQSITSGWTLHAGNVWKRTVANTMMIQRVFIGSDYYEVFENPHRHGGAAALNEGRHWYWAINDPAPGQSTLYMWSGSGSLNPTQVYGSVVFMDQATLSYSGIVGEFNRCNDIEIDSIQFAAATSDVLRLRSCANVRLQDVTYRYMPSYRRCVLIYGDASNNPSGIIEIINMACTWDGRARNYRAAASGASNDDPNGTHDSGGSACILMAGDIANVLIRGGRLEGGVHTAIENWAFSTTGVSGTQNYHIDGVTVISCPKDMYGRAFGVAGHASGGAGRVIIENSNFLYQRTRSQITGGTVTVRRNVFSSSRSDIGNGVPDYYSTLRTHNVNNTAQQLAVQSYNGEVPLHPILIEDNVFVDNWLTPFAGEFYSGEPAPGLVVLNRNVFQQATGPYWNRGQRIIERRSTGSWVPVLTNNRWGRGWVEQVGLFNGSGWDLSPLSAYGAGNVKDTALRHGPYVAPRVSPSRRVRLLGAVA